MDIFIFFHIYIYIYIYGSVLVNEMPKSARYHIDRANSTVFTSKRLPLQPVSSERMKLPLFLFMADISDIGSESRHSFT